MAGNEILAVGDDAIAAHDAQQAVETKPDVVEEVATEEQVETKVETALDKQEEVAAEVEAKEEAGKHFWGDIPVEIEVPTEISEALKEHKIDADALVAELFAKDGKFEVSEKTRAALDKAFGKHIVDGYLNLYKQQNQMSVDKSKSDHEAHQAQLQTNTTDFQTLVGGDDGWNELAEWAGSNMQEADLANFNAVMQLPAEHYQAQRAVVEALQIKRQNALKAAGGDEVVTLLSDSGSTGKAATGAVPATLSRQEFQTLMFSDKYKSDPAYAAQIDNVRRATQADEQKARR